MLERVAIVRYIIIVVVGIGEERVACGKHIACREVGRWQQGLAWVLDYKQALILVVAQVLTQFVAQIGVCVPIAHNLHGLGASYATMIGSYYHLTVHLCQLAEEITYHRVAEPRQGYRAVGTLIIGQLANHLRFGAGVTQHIYEVEHHYVKRVLAYLIHLLHQLVGIGLGVYLVVGKRFLAAIALKLGAYQWFFVQVLTLLLVFIHPKIGEHLLNLVWHQSAEDGVAGILGGCGQDAEIQVFVDIEVLAELLRQHSPLIVAEVIEHHKEHLLAIAKLGEHLSLKYLWR